MNKILGLVLVMGLSSIAAADAKPAEKPQQDVDLAVRGPALIGRIHSTDLNKHVLGYKKSGSLAQANPEKIEAVLTAFCPDPSGETRRKVSTMEVGREWNGNGYLSGDFDLAAYIPDGCKEPSVNVAFNDYRGNWDSNAGANYLMIEEGGILQGNICHTQDTGGNVGHQSWACIVHELSLQLP